MNTTFTPVAAPPKGKAIASLSLGIVSILGFWSWGLTIVPGVLSLVFAWQIKRETGQRTGIARAGYITGLVGLCLSIAFLIFMLVLMAILLEGGYFNDDG